MIFAEPPSTRNDLRFSLGSVPIRIHPFFWLITVLFVAGHNVTPQEVFIWVLVAFVSLLVHELGHVFAFRCFGRRARVVLHGFGGVAIPDVVYDPRPFRTKETVLVSLAGPVAGFLFELLYILFIATLGFVAFRLGKQFGMTEPMAILTGDMFWINIFWGIINLLPIYPLDGGMVVRSLLMAKFNSGLRTSLIISSTVAFAVAAWALFGSLIFFALMFVYLGIMNVRELQETRGWTSQRDQPW